MSKVRQNTVSCRLLKICTCTVWTSLKTFHSGDMASFAFHDDWQLGSFSTKTTPMVLDTITNGVVYEPQASSDDYLNNILSLTLLASTLDSFLLTHRLSSWPNCKCGATRDYNALYILVVTPGWGPSLLTLGACMGGTVVVLRVCLCVCYRTSCYIIRPKWGSMSFF